MAEWAFEGIHVESGRKISISVHPDADLCHSSLAKFISMLDGIARDPLHDLAHALRIPEKHDCAGYCRALAQILGDPEFRESYSIARKDVLSMNHLTEQYCEETTLSFQLMHRSQLDSELCTEDRVHFDSMHDSPFFIGDFNKKRPTGQMELAATVMLRDLIWAYNNIVFVSPTYYWHDQFLSTFSISKESKSGKRVTLDRLLYLKPASVISGIRSEKASIITSPAVQHQTF